MGIIIIDGVVGAGKTTLAEKVSNNLDIKMFYELGNPSTLDVLDLFYKDQKRWSFTLQIHFLNERFKMIKEIQKIGGNGILDRSIFGDRIFAELLYEDEMMTKNEFTTYTTLLDNMLEHVDKPELLVFISCDIETALKRIKSRNREMELGVDKDYWIRLNKKYNIWYDNYNLSEKIIIDANSYHPDNEFQIKKISNNINECLIY